MPNKGKGRGRRRRYMKGNVDEVLPLGALGAVSLTTVPFDDTVVDRTLISSLVATWSIGEFTKATGDGPILVGVAHSDYSAAEIEEVIENTGSWDEGDLISREKANRKVRIIGVFRSRDAAGAVGQMSLNSGKPIKTKLNWILTPGDTLDMFAYNLGSSALTTGALVQAQGHANLWPQ